MEVFEKYVNKFDMDNELIVRKYKHTIRVAGLAKLIAQKLEMDDKYIRLAYLCGLYHDIGRFMQAKKYHSYNDLISIDHGDLGYKVFLHDIANKEDITSREESIIAKSIMYHNKLKVPNNLTNLQKKFIWLTRDADKIDIFYQIANVKNTIHLDKEPVSKEVEECFMRHEAIDYKFVKSETDKNILSLAYIFDIVYNESLAILRKADYLDKIRKILIDSKYNKYFEILENYIKERCKC